MINTKETFRSLFFWFNVMDDCELKALFLLQFSSLFLGASYFNNLSAFSTTMIVDPS